ncbi:hypothetical protein A3H40_04280 [Candidatus Daviesbacteria bacterium RIFCSPLOWO2_02_FULL_38_15]|uniref:Uncharacterized protein n=1 Tax=Candidatus Daviesbacteria bacterium RIFCSPLOWO2_02_FULL_38_15 TaxID=1797794 RepID=A0A1F5N472_9BACT|nr:MAG: hypothetical protein A3H40_04280 [Candidatus Daviesbacteria bacterium RIFCSPLOWO2_02_FULL_38_15]
MEQVQTLSKNTIIKKFISADNPKRLLLTVIAVSVALGTLTGYILSNKDGKLASSGLSSGAPKNAQSDTKTFRDFAEGVVQARPQPSDLAEYVEGTHILTREGAVPVALTSSVMDLSQYEGKKVKVFGETQKALKEGWLMDVGRVDEIK